MRDCAYIYCRKCKRKEWILITQDDINYAKSNGGLFKRIMDHGDHFLAVYIDGNGHLRRSLILTKEPVIQPVVCLT